MEQYVQKMSNDREVSLATDIQRFHTCDEQMQPNRLVEMTLKRYFSQFYHFYYRCRGKQHLFLNGKIPKCTNKLQHDKKIEENNINFVIAFHCYFYKQK